MTNFKLAPAVDGLQLDGAPPRVCRTMATFGLSRLRISAPKPCIAPAQLSRPRISLRPPEPVLRDSIVVHAGAKTAKNKARSIRVQELRRKRNNTYKSAYKAASRAVMRGYANMLEPEVFPSIQQESDLKEIDERMSKAFSAIDRAHKQGLLKRATAARRKRKLTNARKQVLGMTNIYRPEGWKPPPDTLVQPRAPPGPGQPGSN